MAFTRFSNAEGGTNGTTVSTANSGTSGYAFDVNIGAVTFSNAVAQSGTMSYAYPAGSPYLQWNLPSLTGAVWMRSWVYFTALPTSGNYNNIHEVHTNYYNLARISSTGQMQAAPQTYGTQVPGSYIYSVNTWYRVETEFWVSGNQQQVIINTYNNSGTLLETVTSGIGTAPSISPAVAVYFFGNAYGISYQDNLAVSDQGWIGSNTSFTFAKSASGWGAGVTNGTALTVANSGGSIGGVQSDAIDGLNGTGISFSNAQTDFGSLSYLVTGAASYTEWDVPGTSTALYERAYIYFNSLAATQISSLQFNADINTHTLSLSYVAAAGHWELSLSGVTTVIGTTTPVISTWYRIELEVICGATTAQAIARIYNAAGTLLETITTATTGTFTIPNLAFLGQGAAYATSYYLSSVAASDQGWLGPDTTTYPTVVYGTDTGTGTDNTLSGGIVISPDTDTFTGDGAVIYLNDAAGGSQGATAGTGNTGGISGTAFSLVTGGGTVTFDNTEITGPSQFSYKMTMAASYAYMEWPVPAAVQSYTQYVQASFFFNSVANTVIVFNTYNVFPTVQVNAGGYLFARAGTSTSVTGTYAMQANTWYRIEAKFNWTAGTTTARLYSAAGVLLDQIMATGGAYASNSWVLYGCNTNATSTFWMANLGFSTVGWLNGVTMASPPVLGAETGAVGVSGADSGAGTDVVQHVTLSLAADSGAGTDSAPAVTAHLTGVDSGQGTDIQLSLAAALSDADTGTWTDAIYGRTTAASDTVAGTDTSTPKATLTGADSGAGLDLVSLIRLPVADSGAWTDTITLLSLVSADSWTGLDASVLTAMLADSDYWAGIDLALLFEFTPISVQGDFWPVPQAVFPGLHGSVNQGLLLMALNAVSCLIETRL